MKCSRFVRVQADEMKTLKRLSMSTLMTIYNHLLFNLHRTILMHQLTNETRSECIEICVVTIANAILQAMCEYCEPYHIINNKHTHKILT